MIPEPIAILQGLDKISARVSQIEAPVGRSVGFGTLSIMVHDCEQKPTRGLAGKRRVYPNLRNTAR
jgi:hypothetical protein